MSSDTPTLSVFNTAVLEVACSPLRSLCICGNKVEAENLCSVIDKVGDSFIFSGSVYEPVHIEALVLSNIGASTVERFAVFKSLVILNISFNNLSNLHGLNELNKLIQLDISHNKLADISEVSDLTSLEIFRCHNNSISSIEPLKQFNKLSELWISCNLVQWENLIYLQGLSNLKLFVSYGNPLDVKPKVNDFIRGLCPLLKFINGEKLVRINLNTFLTSADGRVMLAQSKAQLSVFQRKELLAIQKIRHTDSPALLNELVSSSSARNLLGISQEIENTLDDTNRPVTSVDKPNKSNKLFKPTDKKYISASRKLLDSTETVNISGVNNNPDESSQKLNLNVVNNDIDIDQGTNKSSIKPEISRIVRFGDGVNGPVALCLYKDGSGYVRYIFKTSC